MYDIPDFTDTVKAALAEDLGVTASALTDGNAALIERDTTSAVFVSPAASLAGSIVAREAGVVCGLPIACACFEMLAAACGLAGSVEAFPLVAEGAAVTAGQEVAEVDGPARVLLAAERTALNFLMVLSGIATEARRWQEAAGADLAVTDTRKTVPGLRALSKYAVVVGGAQNHRFGLFDMALVKDNHRRFARDPADAISRARATGIVVEIEADTIAQAVEAARDGADIVLLDNMDDAMLTRAVAEIRAAARESGRTVLTEASGGITLERVPALRKTGVDRVSSSALTLARPLDFGFDERDA